MLRVVSAGLALAVVAIATAGCSSSSPPSGSRGVKISVSMSACGAGWHDPQPGMQHFVLDNVDSRAGEVDLVDPSTGAVYANVEPLAPGTSTTLTADLGSGRYAFRCAMEDEPAITGPTVVLAGTAKGDTAAALPVSQGDLIPATKAYQQYVTGQLPALLATARALAADLATGRRAAARTRWLDAHLAYIRLGAAYSAFGDLDADIDERADGLPGGVDDPSWHGLHRIEYGLWHGQSTASLVPLGTELVAAVHKLITQFRHVQVDPLDVSIRAHEITEDAVEFALTGRDDYGSHSGLATARGDVDATRIVLGPLRPLLTPRDPALRQVDAQLTRAAHDLDATQVGGRWPAPSALPRPTRERIDADVSELAELLAPVAALLEPRRTS